MFLHAQNGNDMLFTTIIPRKNVHLIERYRTPSTKKSVREELECVLEKKQVNNLSRDLFQYSSTSSIRWHAQIFRSLNYKKYDPKYFFLKIRVLSWGVQLIKCSTISGVNFNLSCSKVINSESKLVFNSDESVL
jgi:hypothetical protein